MAKDCVLRILHVVPSYLPATVYGGPLHSIHSLCKGLVKRGHIVRVLTTDLNGNDNLAVPLQTPVALDGVQVTYFPCRHLRRFAWAPAMYPWLRRSMATTSIVHVHSSFQWPVIAATRAAIGADIPYVFAPRGSLVPELIHGKSRLIKSVWLRTFGPQIVQRAARLHATSEHEYQSATRLGLALPLACIIPNGVDLPPEDAGQVPAELERLIEEPYLLFLGRISWEKGLDRLLAALAGTRLRVLIAGQGEPAFQAALEATIRENNLACIFVGHVQGAAKWKLLRRARALVLPSYSENFGNVVVEALSVACPTVVTDEVGAKDVVERSGGGLVVVGTSTAALRAALERIWNDPDGSRRCGEAGAQYVREHLSWHSIAQATEDVYRDVLACSKRD